MQQLISSNEPIYGSPCFCASNLNQVESAWSTVYNRYFETGLIKENPYGIHAHPAVVGDQSCIIFGPTEKDIDYTVTVIQDSPKRLPLDSVYATQLNSLRDEGHRLLEVGMLAYQSQNASRSMKNMFSMMRWSIYFALHHKVTDVVIGVHPKHLPFYVNSYGFEQLAPMKSYPMVQNNPVILLRLNLQETLSKNGVHLPRRLLEVKNNPVDATHFANRFMFDPNVLIGSRITNLLRQSQQLKFSNRS